MISSLSFKKYISASYVAATIIISLIVALVAANVTHAAVPQYPSGMLAVHRFYNVKTLTHFYTPDENEAAVVKATLPDFRYEGIKYNAYSQPGSDRVAVHRFYNVKTLSHFYTSDQNEVSVIRATLKDYIYEGISYYANDSNNGGSGKAVVYRFYNQKTLTHLYTSDLNEVSVIRATLRDYSFEGAKFGAPESRYFANCTDAKNAGVAPLYRGQVGYGTHLDRDNDGIACETGAPTTPVATLTSIGPVTGAPAVGYTVTSQSIVPYNATVDLKWQVADSEQGQYTDIQDRNGVINYYGYTIRAEDAGKYIRLKATGTGEYVGQTVYSPTIFISGVTTSNISMPDVYFGYNNTVGTQLGAGQITPYDATVNYQWQRSDTKNGSYSNIVGATDSNYLMTSTDLGKYHRLVVTGTGDFVGTITSEPTHNPVSDWGEIGGAGGAGPCENGGGTCGSFMVAFNVNITECQGGYAKNVSTGTEYNFGPGEITDGNTCSFEYTIPVSGNYDIYYRATTDAAVANQSRLFTVALNQEY